jgi:isopenicillin N synthase-like dioxygenase
VSLKLPENFFDDKITKHRSALRLLNYPPQKEAPLPGLSNLFSLSPFLRLYPLLTFRPLLHTGQIRAGEHTDYGTITILKSDPKVRGLQVLTKTGKFRALFPAVLSLVLHLAPRSFVQANGVMQSPFKIHLLSTLVI